MSRYFEGRSLQLFVKIEGTREWKVDLSKPLFTQMKEKYTKNFCKDVGVATSRMLIEFELGNGSTIVVLVIPPTALMSLNSDYGMGV